MAGLPATRGGQAQAREAAARNRSLIASGSDPLAGKRKAAIPTFRQAAERRVPLSSRTLANMEEARAIDDGNGLVFPSPTRPGKPISDMTLTALLRHLKVADRATVHGFRSAFRDGTSECAHIPHAVMELSQAHAVGNAAEAAYARGGLFYRRRALMDQRASYPMSADEGVAQRRR